MSTKMQTTLYKIARGQSGHMYRNTFESAEDRSALNILFLFLSFRMIQEFASSG